MGCESHRASAAATVLVPYCASSQADLPAAPERPARESPPSPSALARSPAALSLPRPRPSQRQPRACRSPARGAGGSRSAGLAAGRGTSRWQPPEALSSGSGGAGGLERGGSSRTGAPPAGRRNHNKPELVAGWEHEAVGRRDPGSGGTLGRGGGFGPPRFPAPVKRPPQAGGSAFPPAGRPCGPRTSCPASPEGGGCRGPGRAELSRGGVSEGRPLRPVGEGAVFNPGPVGLRRQRQATNPREGFEERQLSPTWSLQAVAGAPSPFPGISPEPVPPSAAMKRQSPARQSCISRCRRLLPLLLLLFLHLPGAELGSCCPPAPPGRGARLSLARKPWVSNHRSTWLPKRLSKKNGLPWLAQKQPGMAGSLFPLRELPRLRLDPLQLGYGPLPRPALMPALRRKRRAAQLMRVGCALGTCQVQNLSHRLWQLKGQLGRQDSSPISLHSPHSYG